ncbi:MAG: NAD(P)-dependent oxidoreductase [Chitinophagaceae bacterium]|nr:NAD(P)-dependent oxidoreductase [Chitinophagaceae bacterium]
MKEKVLITGASGFIGFHLIEAALEMGLDVVAAVRRNSDVRHLQVHNIQYCYPDFSDVESIKNELEKAGVNYIIHALGTTKAGSQEEYNTINAGYTYNLAKAAEALGPVFKKLVFISSLAALGPLTETTETITELTNPRPVTAYGKSKLLAEEKLASLSVPYVVLRPTAVYGPREKDIFILFRTIKRGWEPYIGKKDQQLSFVYVKDLAMIGVNALFNTAASRTVFNVSDGRSYSRYQLADTVKAFLRKKTTRIHLPYGMVKGLAFILEKTYRFMNAVPALNREKLNELTAINWQVNIDKAKKELGFYPAYDLEQGVHETMVWYKYNNWI